MLILIIGGIILLFFLVTLAVSAVKKRRAWEKRVKEHKKAGSHTGTKVFFNKP
jgi:hypothetical protein